jgi:excisionase family DNA binding protein
MAEQMTDAYWSVEQIAEYLGVSKDTVYSWISTKGMPAHRLGRLWKFKRDEVDGWVKAGGAAARRDSGPDGEDER